MTSSPTIAGVRALGFDVFGTVVDWRGSIAREVNQLATRKGVTVDGNAFALAWRAEYQPAMEPIRQGTRGFTKLDVLHHENLLATLEKSGLKGKLDTAEIDDLNRVWHRLDPWPDCILGLRRLHHKYPLVTISNGNVSLMVHLARHSGLPWDTILGAEPTQAYKPSPQAYLGTAEYLSLKPEELMLVAAHNADLGAARKLGLRTAFVPRPTEYEENGTKDQRAEEDWDVIAESMEDLASKLGC